MVFRNPRATRAERALRHRAFALAESGRYAAGYDVRRALIGEGWPQAASVLAQEYVSRAIGERCRRAQAAAGREEGEASHR